MSREKEPLGVETVLARVLENIQRSGQKLMVGDSEIKFDFYDLDEYHSEKAEKELRETPELIQESFKVLFDMLAEEEQLYVPLDEKFLKKFLRTCHWYPKSAFKLMKRYYNYQKNHPEYFKDLQPSNERAILSSGILTPLPNRSSDGVRVVIIQAGRKWNPKKVSLQQIFRGLVLNLQIAMEEPKTQVSGFRVIIDMEGLSLSQVTYFTPSFAASIVEFVRTSLPCRLKGVHIVKQSFIFDMVFAFFKPFLNAKIRSRIFFHGKDSPLVKIIDSKILPKRYGGECDIPDDALGENLYEYALHYEDFFLDLKRFGYITE